MHLNKFIKLLVICIFCLTNIIFFIFSYKIFPGNKIVYIFLFLISNFYVFYSYGLSKLFFDKTLSIFLWLGFYYKLSIVLITNSKLSEGAGNFLYKNNQYNELIIFSCIGILAMLLGSFLFHKIFRNYINPKNFLEEEKILVNFYNDHKSKFLFFFLLIIILVFAINSNLGFYQKGLTPKYEINIYLGFLIKWLLLFGLTSISCLLIEYDLKNKKKISLLVISIFFIELFLSNISLLSRALIFPGAAVLYSIYFNYENKIKNKNFYNSLELNIFILLIVFSISIIPINKIRNFNVVDQKFIANQIVEDHSNKITNENKKDKSKNSTLNLDDIKNLDLMNNTKYLDQKKVDQLLASDLNKDEKAKIIEKELAKHKLQDLDLNENFERILFLIKNRFVGLDAVAAVTSYPNNNFNLLKQSLIEKYNPDKYGYYQRTFILPFEQGFSEDQKYIKTSKRHYGIIIPGIIAYLSYPKSKIFLFLSLLGIFFICAFIEITAKIFTFNSIIFSNLIGYVLAYRLIHFGYLPRQTYLILSAILLTIIIIFIIKKLIILKYEKHSFK